MMVTSASVKILRHFCRSQFPAMKFCNLFSFKGYFTCISIEIGKCKRFTHKKDVLLN